MARIYDSWSRSVHFCHAAVLIKLYAHDCSVPLGLREVISKSNESVFHVSVNRKLLTYDIKLLSSVNSLSEGLRRCLVELFVHCT